MDPIVQLKNENVAVRTALAILDKITGAMLRSNLPGAVPGVEDDLDRLLEFFQVFVERCHNTKEERLLLPVMEELGMAREKGPLGEMLADHRHGREAVGGMVAALSGIRRGEAEAAARFAEHARGYSRLLERHIETEENVLFEYAVRHLTTLQMNRLEAEFEQIEEDASGGARHRAFSRMLNELAGKYLDRSLAGTSFSCG